MIKVQLIGITEQLKQTFDGQDMQISFLDDEVHALNAVEQIQPAVILLNYQLQESETRSYIKALLKMSSNSKIVVIAKGLTDNEILACLVAGAKGYQDMKSLDQYMIKMIKVIDAGEAWVSRRMVAKLLDEWGRKIRPISFNRRLSLIDSQKL